MQATVVHADGIQRMDLVMPIAAVASENLVIEPTIPALIEVANDSQEHGAAHSQNHEHHHHPETDNGSSSLAEIDPNSPLIESTPKSFFGSLADTLFRKPLRAIAKWISPDYTTPGDPNQSVWAKYSPVAWIGAAIAAGATLAQLPFRSFDGMKWMRHFMGGFFVTFSAFKLLDLSGFAESYSMYDPIASRVKAWGYVYPFAELALGALSFAGVAPREVSLSSAVLMGISSIGPIRSVLKDEPFQCACLGSVFNLPVSSVTIFEDLLMAGMGAAMFALPR